MHPNPPRSTTLSAGAECSCCLCRWRSLCQAVDPPTLSLVSNPIPNAVLALQAVLGGQPLLIIGVAEPIVLIYGFM